MVSRFTCWVVGTIVCHHFRSGGTCFVPVGPALVTPLALPRHLKERAGSWEVALI